MKTHHSFEHGDVSEALPSILAHVMMDGEEVGTRQGERAKEILMPRIALWKPWQREVLVPGRKASLAAQIAETMWVLAGRNDVEWLSHYLPRAKDFSDDGTTWTGGYGPRIRRWSTDAWGPGQHVDQLSRVVDLLNNERGTRRAVINIYDPAIDSVGGKDVPCNNWISFISRLGKLHMNVATRSNDVIWGWSGINQFEWSVLQEIVAHLTGNQIGTLTFNVTSLHVYEKHWDKAARIVDASGTSTFDHLKDSPRFELDNRSLGRLDDLIQSWFTIEAMIRSGDPAEFHVDGFPEPMMQSWLRVIQEYWAPADSAVEWMAPLKRTRLYVAAGFSPNKAIRQPDVPKASLAAQIAAGPLFDNSTRSVTVEDIDALADKVLKTPVISTRGVEKPLAWASMFVDYVDHLHREKSAVYGNSWNKRGEQISIMANIARKIDRLGVAGAGDSSSDTVIDLLVYALKYRVWLTMEKGAPTPQGALYYPPDLHENDAVAQLLGDLDRTLVKEMGPDKSEMRILAIKTAFEELENIVLADPEIKRPSSRLLALKRIAQLAFPLARRLWAIETGYSPVENTNATRRWEGYEVGENID